VYQGISISFDFSIEEIWTTFAIGATLVPGPTDHCRLGPGLRQYLEENEITVLCCVPTLLSTIDCDLPRLRILIVGGETCPEDLVRRWGHGRIMLNTYGPTETTVTASMAHLVPHRKVTIGKPLPTYSMYILDENLSPVPDGEVGEIYIGGIGVAEGYINRPDKTQECFLPNHLLEHSNPEMRLYRTGDLGLLTADGEIEYFGRSDSQVKIRGHRIELSEVESVLLQNKSIESAAVSLAAVGSMKEIVAYIVLRETRDDEKKAEVDDVSVNFEDALKAELFKEMCSQLPRYEIPAFVEILDDMPLLPSNKVDRRLLPSPSSKRLSACAQTTVPPATTLESHLAEVWQSVFGVKSISVQADFFDDLGGHSLAAAQVVSKLRQFTEFQNLPISDLYAYPTIHSLANHIEEGESSGTQNIMSARDLEIRLCAIAAHTCGFVVLDSSYLSISSRKSLLSHSLILLQKKGCMYF
jgi:acyl carrier protein